MEYENKIKVLLVEDELFILQGLKKLVDWNGLGFEICDTASNYVDAVSAAYLHKPDLIITDIMLGENQKTGLDLVRLFGNLLPEMQAVLLTGYDVFEYAEKAIEYNVKAYLLKPVSAASLTECLLKIKKNFWDRRAEMQYRRQLDEQLQTALPFLFDWFLTSGNEAEWRHVFGLTGREVHWQVAVVSFSGEPEGQHLYELFLKMEGLKENCRKDMISFFQRDQFIYILRSEKAVPDYSIDEIIEIFQKFCDFNGFPNYRIGVGRKVGEFNAISQSYQQAQYACQHIEFFDDNKCIYYSDIALTGEKPISCFSTEKEKLQFAVRTGHVEAAEQFIREIFQKAAEEGASVDTLRSLGMESLVILKEVSLENGIEEVTSTAWKKVALCENLNELCSMIVDSYMDVSSQMNKKRTNRNQEILEKVREMINTGFAKNVTLESVAKLVYLSPTYLSNLFFTEYQISFKDYLIQVRMEEAKRLLLDDRLKVYEIAENVGYSDSRYFSQVFKKYTNMTPLTFRNQFHSAD